MSFFKKIFKIESRPGSYSYRLKRARELHGQSIKYVTERKNGNDDVIGRGGNLTLKDDKFIVDSSGERLFVCAVSELDISMLMSGDGAIISGPDMLSNGRHRSITVHFVYYRK